MTKINYIEGDATEPIVDGRRVIAHIVNNYGGWGRGFVLALSAKWKQPEWCYRKHSSLILGEVQIVPVGNRTIVANMCAQDGNWNGNPKTPACKIKALEICLKQVAAFCKDMECSLHTVRIGCGLGGEVWENIEPLIENIVCERGIDVYVYDLPKKEVTE